MKIARWVFLIAGILGLLPVVPVVYNLFLSEPELVPELASMGLLFYVFLIQYACWRILYIFLARDPLRYRPLMILAFFVEVSVPFNSVWLYFYGFRFWIVRTVAALVFALLFLAAFWLVGREPGLSPA